MLKVELPLQMSAALSEHACLIFRPLLINIHILRLVVWIVKIGQRLMPGHARRRPVSEFLPLLVLVRYCLYSLINDCIVDSDCVLGRDLDVGVVQEGVVFMAASLLLI